MRGLRGTTRSVADVLRSFPAFDGCSRREVSWLASFADEIRVDIGEVLARESALGRHFYVVVEGRAIVSREGRPVEEIGPGAVTGAITDGGRRPATVTAVTPMRLLAVDAEGFGVLQVRAPRVADGLRRSDAV
jgi:CRP-like cAMP-binding protein